MQLVNIGFGNIVSAERIVAIVSPESAPIKKEWYKRQKITKQQLMQHVEEEQELFYN